MAQVYRTIPQDLYSQGPPWDVHFKMIPEKRSPHLRMEVRLVKVNLFRLQLSTQNKAHH